jgi:5'-nucleotidase
LSDGQPRILISNDDGHFSAGITALAAAMAELGEVWVVAPDREQSASSHSLSLFRPLRMIEVRERWYSVDGTPSDCSYLALNHLLKTRRPDIMVSGINHGANLADDVTYSGTVAAAMEASLLGVPSIAFSLVSRTKFDFAPAARFAKAFVKAALQQKLPKNSLFNVNIPGGAEPTCFAVTRLGKHSYGNDVVEKDDPRGRKYYWIGGTSFSHEDIPGSDCNAIFRDRCVSVTPLHLELTNERLRKEVHGWSVEGFDKAPLL